MKVAVTGATGFLGNYVVKELLSLGHDVVVIARNIAKLKSFPWLDQVQVVEHEIGQSLLTFSEIRSPDLLIHLAWDGLPDYKSNQHVDVYLDAHRRFLHELVRSGLNNLVVTGTCLEYGLQTGALSVSNPSCPIVPYAIAKDALRTFLSALQEAHAYKFKWLRLFYMYGNGQNKSSLLEQLKRALGHHESEFNMSGGEQLRDYLPVEVVAKDIVQLSTKIEDSGTYNVCSGIPISVKSFVEKYLQETGQNIHLNLGFYPYPDYEPMTFWGIKNY